MTGCCGQDCEQCQTGQTSMFTCPQGYEFAGELVPDAVCSDCIWYPINYNCGAYNGGGSGLFSNKYLLIGLGAIAVVGVMMLGGKK